jgi:hypothetical protein
MTADQRIRFAREIRLRRRGHPDQMLRVLQDDAGWYYVLRLAGTHDFGPYLLDEITSAFDVEPEPLSVHELRQAPSDTDSEPAPPNPADQPL